MTRNLRSYACAILPASAGCIVFLFIKWLFTGFLQWFTYAAVEKQLFSFFIFFSVSWILYRLATEGLQLMAVKIHAPLHAVRFIIVLLSVSVAVALMTWIFRLESQSAMYVRIMCQLLIIQMPAIFIYDMVKRPGCSLA